MVLDCFIYPYVGIIYTVIMPRTFAFFILLNALSMALSLPSFMFLLKTSQPIMGQLFRLFVSVYYFTSVIGLSGCIALFLGFVYLKSPSSNYKNALNKISAVIALGVLYKCLVLITIYLGHGMRPTWAYYEPAGDYAPSITTGLALFNNYLTASIFLMGIILIFNSLSTSWAWYIAPIFFMLIGIIMSPVTTSIGLWLLGGVFMGFILYLAYRYLIGSEPQLVLWFYAASITISIALQLMYHAYPGACMGNIFGLILVWSSCYYLYTYLSTKPD